MPADGRVGAWMAAWSRLEAADKLLRKNGIEHQDVRRMHGALVAQARVYTDLASAPEDIGLAAGDWLQQEYIRDEEEKQQVADVLERLKGKTDGR